jgi:hypothetical protein
MTTVTECATGETSDAEALAVSVSLARTHITYAAALGDLTREQERRFARALQELDNAASLAFAFLTRREHALTALNREGGGTST